MHVHVRQVAFVGVERGAVERRIGLAVERPALGTTLTGSLRIARRLALTAIERGEMSARAPVLPDHALMIGFDAARSEDLDRLIRRRLVKLGLAGNRRVRAALETHQALGAAADAGAPQAAVFRIDGDGIAAEVDPVILGRVDRLIGLGPPPCNLAVVVRVEYCRAPTLGGFGVVRLVPRVHVDPADRAVHPEVKVVVRVEHVVVGAEAGVDVLVLVGLLIVLGDLTSAAPQRVVGRELVRARRAERRLLLQLTQPDRHPEPPVLIDGGAAHVGGTLPHVLAPEGRRGRRGVERGDQRWRLGRDLDVAHPVLDRLQHRQRVDHFRDAIDGSVGIRRGNARVAGDVVGAPVDR